MKKMSLIYTSSVAHNPERATRIPAVTTFSSFILRYILKFFFPRTRELCPVHERIIRSIRYDKGKLNVTFRSFGFAEWFVGPKRYSKFAPKSF